MNNVSSDTKKNVPCVRVQKNLLSFYNYLCNWVIFSSERFQPRALSILEMIIVLGVSAKRDNTVFKVSWYGYRKTVMAATADYNCVLQHYVTNYNKMLPPVKFDLYLWSLMLSMVCKRLFVMQGDHIDPQNRGRFILNIIEYRLLWGFTLK